MDTPPPPAAPPHPPRPEGGEPGDRFTAARQRAVRVLTDAYAEGAVGEAEFERRLARLKSASDTVQMEAVVDGLPDAPARPSPLRPAPAAWATPGAPHVSRPAGTPAAPARPASVQRGSALPPGERRVLAFASEIKRRGWWEVPPLLRVVSVMGDLELDLRDTVIPAGCTFEVACYLAAVKIIVRPGTNVWFDVHPTLGSATSRAPSLPTEPDLRVTGDAVLGEVKVVVRERGEGRKRRSASSWWGGGGGWGGGS